MRLWILYIKNGFTGLGCSSAARVKPWIQSLTAKNQSVRERHEGGREGKGRGGTEGERGERIHGELETGFSGERCSHKGSMES